MTNNGTNSTEHDNYYTRIGNTKRVGINLGSIWDELTDDDLCSIKAVMNTYSHDYSFICNSSIPIHDMMSKMVFFDIGIVHFYLRSYHHDDYHKDSSYESIRILLDKLNNKINESKDCIK